MLAESRRAVPESWWVLAESRRAVPESRRVLAESRRAVPESRWVLAESRRAGLESQWVLAESRRAGAGTPSPQNERGFWTFLGWAGRTGAQALGGNLDLGHERSLG